MRRPRARALALLAAPLVAALVTTAAAGWVPYRIVRGDSLWALARSHHTTVAAIQRANGLRGDRIIAGALLSLPGAGVGAVSSPACGTSAGTPYTVRSGDSLTAIARRYGVTLSALAGRNRLDAGRPIIIGQRLTVPTAARAAARAAACGATTSTAQVTSLIQAKAAQYGVDPALALGIASVESGFNQAAVSNVGAVGVMQLMPRTAVWLNTVVGRPLDRQSLSDNITGGVAYLHYLLAATDRSTAIASYYQGLRSVTRQGMFPDTRRYVANVLARRAHYA